MLIASEEARHVDRGPRPDEAPAGLGLVAVSVFAKNSAADVIKSARSVLRVVLAMGPDELRSPGTVVGRLPQWFVANCAAERPPEVDEQWLTWWRGLEPEAKARAAYERPWTLDIGAWPAAADDEGA